MPEFKFKVQLGETVSVISPSEEQAREVLHRAFGQPGDPILDRAFETGTIARIENRELIAVDHKPLRAD